MLPLAVAGAAAAAGSAVLVIAGAPQALIALIIAMLTGLAVTAAITRYWKISLHTGVAAGTATILTIVFGPGLLVTGLVVTAIGWSRVQLRDHTSPQAILGTIVGAVVAAVGFLAMR